MRALSLLPNLLTLGNLAAGSWAIALSYQRDWIGFALALSTAMFCDWLDGGMARFLHAESSMGKELDALADLVSFGLAPAFALYNYLRPEIPLLPYDREVKFWMVMVPFILPLLAAWRLARFNAAPSSNLRFFVGLPTPAHGAFWGLWIISAPRDYWLHPVVWIGTILSVGLLMVSELPFFSLKSRQNVIWAAFTLALSAVGALYLPGANRVIFALAVYGVLSYVAARFYR
ncbi:MAG: CDP-alcohol phosphatidyltransferase family protein [Bacteroidia bacterium]|nr:CDP-alcohol phosphatidyltransferase family protein [Bacteroidia bacterium]MCX7651253.1 CDP-alcohol phosphatidyltransferase family protein [Bacteroidia bacterium]MDW8416201.1 CDP-alcohol phosphatidyltransferase family protein [Bacteroidia bacterium]